VTACSAFFVIDTAVATQCRFYQRQSLRVPENLLQFEGQTKEKLGTPEARTIVDNIVSEQLQFFLMENGEFAQMLIRKSTKARQAREAARKARDESRNGKRRHKQERLLSGKLTPSPL
ncbi:hypothetical protein WP50_12955, partial [Lactiplantibacillus plantarum]